MIDKCVSSESVGHACWQQQYMVNLYNCSISVITETQFAIQTQVTQQTKLYGTYTCGCNNNTIFQKGIFHVSYRRRMLCTLSWQRPSIGGA